MNNDNNSSKSNASVKLMKLLEKMEMDKLNPYQVDKYVDAAIFFVILAVIVCYKCGKEFHIEHYNFFCPECDGILILESGRELQVESLDME